MFRLVLIALLLGPAAMYGAGLSMPDSDPDPVPALTLRDYMAGWPFMLPEWLGMDLRGLTFNAWTATLWSAVYAVQNLVLFLFVRAVVAELKDFVRTLAPAAGAATVERSALLIAFPALVAAVGGLLLLPTWQAALAASAVLYACSPKE